MSIDTALYQGIVRHTRVNPRKLALRHRCFWLALDVDRIDLVAKRLAILSRNAFNILSVNDGDFGDGSVRPLRSQIEKHIGSAGINARPAKIILFGMPRVLGYGFNPICLYFCLSETDAPMAIVYEVHNTFGERHSYVAAVKNASSMIEQTAEKAFYVSPFMDMDMRYRFKLVLSDKRLSLSINASNVQGPVIFTSLHADRSELTSGSLFKAWVSHPLLSLKVITAIHFHALRLWFKGIKLRLRPPPPVNPATIGKTGKPTV